MNQMLSTLSSLVVFYNKYLSFIKKYFPVFVINKLSGVYGLIYDLIVTPIYFLQSTGSNKWNTLYLLIKYRSTILMYQTNLHFFYGYFFPETINDQSTFLNQKQFVLFDPIKKVDTYPDIKSLWYSFLRHDPSTPRKYGDLSIFFTWFANTFIHFFIDTNSKDRTLTDRTSIYPFIFYGKTKDVEKYLRSRNCGKMWLEDNRMPTLGFLKSKNDGNLPPKDILPLDSNGNDTKDDNLYISGIQRINGHIGYFVIGTLFLRFHNLVCDIIVKNEKSTLDQFFNDQQKDEFIFNRATQIVSCMALLIIEYEYVPSIAKIYPFYINNDLLFNKLQNYFYKKIIPFDIAKQKTFCEYIFTYAFHSMVPTQYTVKDKNNDNFVIDTSQSNNNLKHIVDNVPIEQLLISGLTLQAGEIFSPQNTPEFLFRADNGIFMTQRANNIVSFNDVREICGIPRITSFLQLTTDPVTQTKFEALYKNVDNLDLYTGMHYDNNGAMSDRLFVQLLSQEFSRVPYATANVYNNLPKYAQNIFYSCPKTGYVNLLLDMTIDRKKYNVPYRFTMYAGDVVQKDTQDFLKL